MLLVLAALLFACLGLVGVWVVWLLYLFGVLWLFLAVDW